MIFGGVLPRISRAKEFRLAALDVVRGHEKLGQHVTKPRFTKIFMEYLLDAARRILRLEVLGETLEQMIRKDPLTLVQVQINKLRSGKFRRALCIGNAESTGQDTPRRGAGNDVEKFDDRFLRRLFDLCQNHCGDDPPDTTAVNGKNSGHDWSPALDSACTKRIAAAYQGSCIRSKDASSAGRQSALEVAQDGSPQPVLVIVRELLALVYRRKATEHAFPIPRPTPRHQKGIINPDLACSRREGAGHGPRAARAWPVPRTGHRLPGWPSPGCTRRRAAPGGPTGRHRGKTPPAPDPRAPGAW